MAVMGNHYNITGSRQVDNSEENALEEIRIEMKCLQLT